MTAFLIVSVLLHLSDLLGLMRVRRRTLLITALEIVALGMFFWALWLLFFG